MDEKKLYHFFKTHETGIRKKNGEVEAWVHIYFYEVEEFADIIGENVLCEGYVKATIMSNTIAVELIDSVLWNGEIEEYKDCFDKDDWERAWRSEE